MSEERGKDTYPCTVEGCSKEYANCRSLKQHLKIAHDQSDAVKKGRFTCKECDQSFYHASKLAQHCSSQHGETSAHV